MSETWRKCPECDGFGSYDLVRSGVNCHGPWVDYFARKCPECDGDGEILVDE